MTGPDLLYPAIFVFALMVIGLVLTIREFSQERHLKKPQDQPPIRGPVAHADVSQSNQ